MTNEKWKTFKIRFVFKSKNELYFWCTDSPSVYKTFSRFSIDLKFHDEFLILNWKLNLIKNMVRIQFSTTKFNWKSNGRFMHGRIPIRAPKEPFNFQFKIEMEKGFLGISISIENWKLTKDISFSIFNFYLKIEK